MKFLKSGSETYFMTIALVVGIITGLGAILLDHLIDAVVWLGYEWFPELTSSLGNVYIFIIPAIGGLIVGPLIYLYAREAKGHGVPEVMEAVALRGGRIRPIVAVVKAIASAITIGSGGSAGREGPMVQIGSGVGSFMGQKFGLSDDRIRNLVACGAAAGIAATFNAPIAGVVFAVEIILGEFRIKYLTGVVISAVTASVIGQAAFGNAPTLHIPIPYGINSLWEFAFYPVLGLFLGFMGMVFVRILYWTEDLFEDWKSVPAWVKPAVGGLLLGFVALAYPLLSGNPLSRVPQVYNVGYELIESVLANELTLQTVLVLFVLKILATSLTLGSGGSGGIFAPGLFMGAMLGTAFEIVANKLFPGIAAPPGAYAIVGMAAFFSATAHAPMSSILIIFELTGDYKIMLPLMLTVVISTFFAQKLLKGESIYTLKLTRRGVHLKQGRDVDVLQGVLVSEVMTRDVNTITHNMSLKELSQIFNQTRKHGIAVLNTQGKLWGMVTISDLEKAINDGLALSQTTVAQVGTPHNELVTAFPDESIGDALNKMSRQGYGRLPVITREDPLHLCGIIQRRDIIDSYQIALTKRAEIQQRTERMKVRNIDGAEFLEMQIASNSPATNKTVSEIAATLPPECILVSIRRNDKLLIPHGSTVFQPGDKLTAFARSADTEMVYQVFFQK